MADLVKFVVFSFNASLKSCEWEAQQPDWH